MNYNYELKIRFEYKYRRMEKYMKELEETAPEEGFTRLPSGVATPRGKDNVPYLTKMH